MNTHHSTQFKSTIALFSVLILTMGIYMYKKSDTRTEHIKNPVIDIQNLKDNLIQADSPIANSVIMSPLTISGKARGQWFFEASFPISLIDSNGKEVVTSFATAQGEWMTEEFVPFSKTVTFAQPETATGTLILKKDNPSGDPVRDDELLIPVRFK